jgi:signal transduction histidine kinase
MQKKRLLIVEDRDEIQTDLRKWFEEPPLLFQQAYHSPGFDVTAVKTGIEAQAVLKDAAATMRPYDGAILDLGIPKDSGMEPFPEVGMDVLESISDDACLAVVIHSIHQELPLFIRLLKSRSAVFMPKDSNETGEHIFRSVVQACEDGRLRQKGRWEDWQRRRSEQWLLIQSGSRMADHLTRIVSDGITNVLSGVSRMQSILENDYRLDPKEDGALAFGTLHQIEQAALETMKNCATRRSQLNSSLGTQEQVVVESVLKEVAYEMREGLFFRRLSISLPEHGTHRLHAFWKEAISILRELLYYAVVSSDESSELRFGVRQSTETSLLEISVTARGSPIDDEMRRGIGEPDSLEQKCGNEWDLSLAQRVAQNIGARINVESTATGNTFTLSLPVFANE